MSLLLHLKREFPVENSRQTTVYLQTTFGIEFLPPEAPEVLLLTGLIDPLDLSGRQLESCSSQIIAQSLLFAGSRDGCDVLVNAPSQTDLTRADSILLLEGSNNIVHWTRRCSGNCGEGSVGCEDSELVFV